MLQTATGTGTVHVCVLAWVSSCITGYSFSRRQSRDGGAKAPPSTHHPGAEAGVAGHATRSPWRQLVSRPPSDTARLLVTSPAHHVTGDGKVTVSGRGGNRRVT